MVRNFLGVALVAVALIGCDVDSSPGAPNASASSASPTRAITSPVASTAPSATPTATPPPVFVPPPPPPTAAPAPKIVAVPLSGPQGTTFVFQLSGFPKTTNGQDIVQTVTTPAGRPLGPTIFTTRPDGTGLTTFKQSPPDPSGIYTVRINAPGGISVQTTFQVN